MAEPEGPTLVDLERAERRRRILAIVGLTAIVVGTLLYLFVPRTLASGDIGDQRWRVRAAPVVVNSEISLSGADVFEGPSRATGPGGLEGTVLWRVGDPDGEVATIVAGPTPAGATSVRVTTDEFGVGEARIRRVGWRHFHVHRIRGHAEAVELVAIDERGRPIEVTEFGSGSAGSGSPGADD